MDQCLAGEDELAGNSIWILRDLDGISAFTFDARCVKEGGA